MPLRAKPSDCPAQRGARPRHPERRYGCPLDPCAWSATVLKKAMTHWTHAGAGLRCAESRAARIAAARISLARSDNRSVSCSGWCWLVAGSCLLLHLRPRSKPERGETRTRGSMRSPRARSPQGRRPDHAPICPISPDEERPDRTHPKQPKAATDQPPKETEPVAASAQHQHRHRHRLADQRHHEWKLETAFIPGHVERGKSRAFELHQRDYPERRNRRDEFGRL